RSRLTGLPELRIPRLVRAVVSSETSNASASPWLSTTVKHVPLTATDAPIVESTVTVRHSTTSRPPERSRTRPSSSMIPENICLHPKIGADPFDRRELELHRSRDRRESAPHHHARCGSATGEDRREVHDHAIDEALVHETPGERRATFHDQPLHVPLPEGFH